MNPLGSGDVPGQSNVPTPGVWPPPPTGMPGEIGAQANTSGTKGEVPPEIARLKWNWGAFLLPFLWSVNHRITWGWGILALSLLSRVPTIGPVFAVASIVVSVYLGMKGSALGWQNRRFEGGVPQYFEVQRKWLTWGVGVIAVIFIFALFGGIVAGIARHSGTR